MPESSTRLCFLGSAALANGFRLAGFEVYPGAGVDTLERLLRELREQRAHAFVILDQALAEADCKELREIRAEGGRILLTQVPPLNRPDDLRSGLDDPIELLMGNRWEAG
ncbi:MAG: ATPase [Gammaproteobacteria bacterium]|nr:ATPase [Gammaproteobacteria bacterium]MBU1655239.1 ATPase [Gammaproteobacteria bacterium]MBU1961332.1 ATPase [Gammaproteobacteria bacterium]